MATFKQGVAAVGFVWCGLAAGAVCAQAPQNAGPADASQRLAAQLPVARLSYLAGSVTVQAEDGTSAPVDAALNMPIPQGQRLSTGDNGEAEIEFGDGSVLRITPRSEAAIEQIDPESRGTSLQLGNGLFYLELRASDRGAYTVGAGDVLLAPEQNVSFRVRVQDGQVETAVLAGGLSVTRPNAYTAVLQAGESLRTDPKNGQRYLLADTVSPETFDRWNERLAQAAQDEQSARTAVRDAYAGQQAYGWADLDANGSWYDVPGEGEVWQPTVADASFDPYGNGAWVSGPGGYAFASGYGWGWLPYRCGLWTFYPGFGWGWSPAGGCVNFGFDGGYGGYGDGGGYRVRHPPAGWHPPHRPIFEGTLPGSIHRRPTIPVRARPLQVSEAPSLPQRKAGEPVHIAGFTATPVKRIGLQVTPQGGSAVGSSLLRDFPVRPGTHEPVLGVVSQAPVAVPGRAADWRRARSAEGAPAAGDVVGERVLRGNVGARPGVSDGSTYADGHLPRPTDPPVGAAGAPPVGANGASPLGANGAPPLGAVGRPGFGTSGTSSPRAVAPSLPRAVGPVQPVSPAGGVARPVPSAPAPRVSAPAPAPHMAPAPSPPAAPRAAPAPSAPAAPAATHAK